MSETKNQVAWDSIERKTSFVQAVTERGEFDIEAQKIKDISGREPRLMAKFDHSINRPKIFLDQGISILPVSASAYKLIRFNSYQNVSCGTDVTALPSSPLKKFQTINLDDIRSEDGAIIVADISRMIALFVGEKEVRLTSKGKFRTRNFGFYVNAVDGIKQVIVNKAQAELDAGFEGDKFYLLEAKMGKVDDFNIRQLYYPYRFWSGRIKKEVVPIFFTYSDSAFHFWRFKFSDPDDFNSIQLVSQKSYIFGQDESVSDDDISVKANVSSVTRGAPFPQADDFEKVINIVELIYSGVTSKEDFADYFSFDKRQADYYYNAAKYLELVEDNKKGIFLTEFGDRVASATRIKRHKLLARAILSRGVFNDVFRRLLDGLSLDTAGITGIMRKHRVLESESDAMFKRRAQTIIAWCRWIQRTLQKNR
jgi:hypothetical protein